MVQTSGNAVTWDCDGAQTHCIPRPPQLQAALAYVEAGWCVFPMGERTDNLKRPYCRHGFKDATRDRATIRRWWKTHPRALIGAVIPDGVVVVDFDCGHDGAAPGEGTPGSLEQALGVQLPPTRVARTGSGGWHYYYQVDPETAYKTTQSVLAPHVDTLTAGHAVILPPSHPEGKQPYMWVNGCTDLATLPAGIADLITVRPAQARPRVKRRNSRRAVPAGRYTRLFDWLAGVPKGKRNSSIFAMAMRLYEDGASRAAFDQLEAVAAHLADGDTPELKHYLKTINVSARKHAQRKGYVS